MDTDPPVRTTQMAMSEHTAKAFDVDLQELNRMIAEMGGLAEKLVADSVEALSRRDSDAAQDVVAADPSIDNLQREIEEKAVLTIARRQPMAVDLRRPGLELDLIKTQRMLSRENRILPTRATEERAKSNILRIHSSQRVPLGGGSCRSQNRTSICCLRPRRAFSED